MMGRPGSVVGCVVMLRLEEYRPLARSLYSAPTMANDPSISRAIAAVGEEMEWPLGAAEADALAQFARLFLLWNERINLASLGSPAELVERHFIDSFAAARLIGDSDWIVDVGSGGGLPAIPLALLRPSCRLDLFEPIRKKVAFLRTAVRELGLTGRVNVHASAIERPIPVDFAQAVDVAMSRATLAPPAWLDLANDLVRPGGQVLVFTTGRGGDGLPPAPVRSLQYGANRVLKAFPR